MQQPFSPAVPPRAAPPVGTCMYCWNAEHPRQSERLRPVACDSICPSHSIWFASRHHVMPATQYEAQGLLTTYLGGGTL